MLAIIIFIHERRERKKLAESTVDDVQLEPVGVAQTESPDSKADSLYQTLDLPEESSQVPRISTYSHISRSPTVVTASDVRTPSYSFPIRPLRLNPDSMKANSADADETAFGFHQAESFIHTVTQFEQPGVNAVINRTASTVAMPSGDVRRWNPSYHDEEFSEDV